MKKENEKTTLQQTVERLGKELAQAVEDAIAAGAETKDTITGGAIVDGVYFGMNAVSRKPIVLLDVPCSALSEICRKAELEEKRQRIEELENELKELKELEQ